MARDAGMKRAEDAARAVSKANGHALGRFSWDGGDATTRTARCSRCGEGASYDVVEIDASLLLGYIERPCRRRPAR